MSEFLRLKKTTYHKKELHKKLDRADKALAAEMIKQDSSSDLYVKTEEPPVFVTTNAESAPAIEESFETQAAVSEEPEEEIVIPQYIGQTDPEEPEARIETAKERKAREKLAKKSKAVDEIDNAARRKYERLSGKTQEDKKKFSIYEDAPETPEEREERAMYDRINNDGFYNLITPLDENIKVERRKKKSGSKEKLIIVIVIAVLLIAMSLTLIKYIR